MKKIFFICCILISILSFSQSIKGKVLDENKQPLVGANVYFDGTTPRRTARAVRAAP